MNGGAIAAAENDFIVGASRASEGAGGVVFCIAVGLGALALEKLRVSSGTAIVHIIPRAAILRGIESSAGALASVGNYQSTGADGSYVAAADNCTARRVGWYDRHWQVESIDERDVIIVTTPILIESVLDHSHRGASIILTV